MITKKEKVFDNIGKTIKKLFYILFYICLWLGIIFFAIGFIGALSVSVFNGYPKGFISIITLHFPQYDWMYLIMSYGIKLIVASVISLLGYGFGELIEKSKK